MDLLSANQVLVRDKCPKAIIDYLKMAGMEVIEVPNLSEDIVVKNMRGDVFHLNLHEIN